MNNKFDELAKGLAQSVTRLQALKQFGVSSAAIALTFGLLSPAQAQTSLITDPAGDATWPFALYDGPVPPYLDIVQASVTLKNGVFHFAVKMAVDIPGVPDPGLSPSVNHLGVTVAIQTDRSTSGTPFKFIGQTDEYHFNFLVGALYSFADSGLGLPLGWTGYYLDTATFSTIAIPVQLRGDTFIFETSAASLGNPASFQWVVATECDPVPVPDEKTRSVLLEDYAPDHDYAIWPDPAL